MDYKTYSETYPEVKEYRDLSSKTFDKGNGEYTLVASRKPLHYKGDDGLFHNIDMNIIDGNILKNNYTIELLKDSIGYSIVSRIDNSRIDVKLRSIGNKSIKYVEPTIEGNTAVWYDIDTDTDFLIEFRGLRVRCWKRLKSNLANTEIEFEVFEDDEKSTLNVVEKIVGYDANHKKTIQEQVKHSKKLIKTKKTKKNVKNYKLKQTFLNKVIVMDDKTRVKSESTNIAYPIMIDADVTISVNTSNDDGFDVERVLTWSTYNLTIDGIRQSYNYNYIQNQNFNTGYFQDKRKYAAYTRFTGITIPQSSTINSAALNLYTHYDYRGYGTTLQVKAYAFDENDPSSISFSKTVDLVNKTTGLASNNGTTTIVKGTGTAIDSKANYLSTSIDVGDVVQELVNSYDYSSEAMLFFYRTPNEVTNTTIGDRICVYGYDWGTTKAPELVINYTAPVTGWTHDISGISNVNINKVNEILKTNISKINNI